MAQVERTHHSMQSFPCFSIAHSPEASGSAPGNVRLPVKGTGLAKVSVANVSQIITVDKTFLTERIGKLNPRLLAEVDAGLRIVLSV